MNTIIEETAIELAKTTFEEWRKRDLPTINPKTKAPYKDEREFAKVNWERFIDYSVKTLTEMLGKAETPELIREQIYDALTTRANFEPTINGYKVGHLLDRRN